MSRIKKGMIITLPVSCEPAHVIRVNEKENDIEYLHGTEIHHMRLSIYLDALDSNL